MRKLVVILFLGLAALSVVAPVHADPRFRCGPDGKSACY